MRIFAMALFEELRWSTGGPYGNNSAHHAMQKWRSYGRRGLGEGASGLGRRKVRDLGPDLPDAVPRGPMPDPQSRGPTPGPFPNPIVMSPC